MALLLLFSVVKGFSQNISKAEYFIDTDPGFGNGTGIPVTPGLDVTASFQFNVNALPAGFHSLFVRAYVNPYTDASQSKGGWSLVQSRTFYKEAFPTETTSIPNVTKGEYFIDSDPGFGNGTNISFSAAKDVTNVTFSININSLATGFHDLLVRFKDADGKWGLTQRRTFYKESLPTGNATLPNVVAGEYFVDTDPGFGKGHGIPFTAGADITNLTFSVNPSSLSTGFHQLFTRFKDANGQWGLTNTRAFYKDSITSTSPLSNKGEVDVIESL